MKLKSAIVIFVGLLATWVLGQGMDISGTWKMKTVSPRGTTEQTVTFKQAGDSFTGEMITSQGAKEAIKNGKVSGDEIEFGVERQQPSGETALVAYKGKVKGDEINGTFVGASGRSIDWTAQREGPAKP